MGFEKVIFWKIVKDMTVDRGVVDFRCIWFNKSSHFSTYLMTRKVF